mmetsp:Transcript_8414/g.18985  ORF Transcript_8414/g.18985 Transcript_8414/m.18985 type:complete len:82 (-) Transcript_8414:290-535(-)
MGKCGDLGGGGADDGDDDEEVAIVSRMGRRRLLLGYRRRCLLMPLIQQKPGIALQQIFLLHVTPGDQSFLLQDDASRIRTN